MSEYSKAQLAAMRRRWAKRRAARLEREAREAPLITPEWLHERALDECGQRKAAHQRHAREMRQRQAEAKVHGADDIAVSLGMLAVHHELNAALAEAERRDRIEQFKRSRRAEANRERARRPRGRRPLRDLILEALAPLRREGVQFKVALRRWERERIGGLRLDDLGAGRYCVTDENGSDDAAKAYTRGTLEKLYSVAGR